MAQGGFSVDADAVDALGRLVTRAGDGAADYWGAFQQVIAGSGGGPADTGEGLLARIWPRLDEWQREGEQQTRQAAALGISAGDELHCVATWYRATDRDSAARLDRLLHFPPADRVRRDQVRDPAAAGSFRDVVPINYTGPDPAKVRDPSWWPVKVEKKAREILALGGTAGTLAQILEYLTGMNKDIFALAAEAVIGDWTSLQRQAVLFSDTADGFDGIAANINEGRYGIQDRWTGEAADQAENWLERYHRGCTELVPYCRAASEAIEGLAESAYHLMEDLRDTLAAILDLLLLLYAKGVIAARKLGKDVLDIISELVDALGKGKNLLDLAHHDVVTLVQDALSLIEKVGIAQSIIEAIFALVHTFGLLHGVSKAIGGTAAGPDAPHDWPEHPYHHPQAGCDDDERARKHQTRVVV